MTNPRLLRALGILLVAAAIMGLVANVAGLFAVAIFEHQIRDSLLNGIDVVDGSLSTTSQGLEVADGALAQASQTMTDTQRALSTAGQAIGDTVPSLRTLSRTVGDDVPRIIESTREAVLAAQSSASAMDAVIDGVSRIPLLGLARYRPEKPLGESLGEVAASLETLPDAVRDMRSGLEDSTANAGTIQGDLSELAHGLGQLGATLEQARGVVADYRVVVGDLQEQAERARERTPIWLGRFRWAAWFVLVWLAVAQIGLLTQGLELITRSRTGASS